VANYGSSPFPSISGEWSIGVANCAAAEWTSPMGPVGTCELSAPNFAQYVFSLSSPFLPAWTSSG